jgi:ankyrin repeat protein
MNKKIGILLCLVSVVAGCKHENPLIMPVATCNLMKVREAISNGANVNDGGSSGGTMLVWVYAPPVSAASTPVPAPPNLSCRLEEIKLLLEAGADPNLPDNYGHTVLMAAACYGHSEAVDLLLKAGAKSALKDRYGHTAAYYAAQSQHLELATRLK